MTIIIGKSYREKLFLFMLSFFVVLAVIMIIYSIICGNVGLVTIGTGAIVAIIISAIITTTKTILPPKTKQKTVS